MSGVRIESLSNCPGFWFGVSWVPSKGVPVTPHYLSPDIAVDITVTADSDSTLNCERCPKSALCLCSAQ